MNQEGGKGLRGHREHESEDHTHEEDGEPHVQPRRQPRKEEASGGTVQLPETLGDLLLQDLVGALRIVAPGRGGLGRCALPVGHGLHYPGMPELLALGSFEIVMRPKPD